MFEGLVGIKVLEVRVQLHEATAEWPAGAWGVDERGRRRRADRSYSDSQFKPELAQLFGETLSRQHHFKFLLQHKTDMKEHRGSCMF